MNSFLSLVSKDVTSKFPDNGSVCLVFPNKRTKYAFNREVALSLGVSSWAYPSFTINNVIDSFSDLKICDQSLILLFDLYQSFCEVFADQESKNFFLTESFDAFFDTGNKLLADFNEIDGYLVEINQLCRNIADLDSIDAELSSFTDEQINIIRKFWSLFSNEHLSNEKLRYKELWENLPGVYNSFNNLLVKKKIGYNGMVYRHVCKKIKDGKLNPRYKTYIFIGFNSLNKAEQYIFKYLKVIGSAAFYWDYDSWYFNDTKREAGHYMRQNIEQFSDNLFSKPPDNFLKLNKKIEIIKVSLAVAQAKCVYDIVSDFYKNDPGGSVAVVPVDEGLLFPLLGAIPENIDALNVTMGYPFKHTSVYSFIDNCLKLRSKFSLSKKDGQYYYYYKDIVSILKHPLLSDLKQLHIDEILSLIRDKNLKRIPASLPGTFHQLFDTVFNFVEKEINAADLLNNLMVQTSEIFFLKNPDEKPSETVENEYLYQLYTTLKQLSEVITRAPEKFVFSKNLTVSLVIKQLAELSISFESENVDGLQIIGMMETRNLDFDNIVIPGMNEDIFPRHSKRVSFITESMRSAFGLPVVKNKDAGFAYLFYRLLQRAKNIKIIYNGVPSDSSSGEMSRLVMQLIQEVNPDELNKLNIQSNVDISFKKLASFPSPLTSKLKPPEKTDYVINFLRRYLAGENNQSYFSASALKTYISCPLKFYYKYIAGLNIDQPIQEELQINEIGDILHAAMQDFYLLVKDENNVVNIDAVEKAKGNIHDILFNVKTQNTEVAKLDIKGPDLIVMQVIEKYMISIINFDKTFMPFTIISLEQAGKHANISVVINNKPEQVVIGGRFDRIDRLSDSTLRIIDYKTGKVDNKFSIDKLFTSDSFNDVAFQMLFYSSIYLRHNKDPKLKFQPVVYSVRAISSNRYDDCFFITDDKQPVRPETINSLIQEFDFKLKEVFEQMFDRNIPFCALPGKGCDYCDYGELCNVRKKSFL